MNARVGTIGDWAEDILPKSPIVSYYYIITHVLYNLPTNMNLLLFNFKPKLFLNLLLIINNTTAQYNTQHLTIQI
jgi:hypothetical protein